MPRPEVRRRFLFLLTAFVPFLLGGRVSEPGFSRAPSHELSADPSPEGPPTDSVAVWVFLSDSAWSAPASEREIQGFPGRIRTRSEWLRALSLEVSRQDLAGLPGLPGVRAVLPVRRLSGPRGSSDEKEAREIRRPGAGGPEEEAADSVYGGLEPFLSLMEVPAAHNLGFRGTGTRVGIIDGLFRSGHLSLQGHPPLAARDFVEQDGSVEPGLGDLPGAASHGTALWSLVSADWPGHLTGVAPGAGVLLARVVSDADPTSADEDRWVAALEWLETQGARIVVSGVGFRDFDGGRYTSSDLNGDVAPATVAADEAARRGVLVLAPVGNGGPGPQTLQSPADGDSVMAVGSVNLEGAPSPFSANGPTSDGRSKPDAYAPGNQVPAAANQDAVTLVGGTEFAASLLAGLAAAFVEAYPERGPMEVAAALMASASTVAGSSWSVPRLAPAILFPDGVLPLPLQELDGEGRVTSLAPQFQWNIPTTHPLGLPVAFRLEFSEDSLFQSVLLRDSVVGTFARRLGEPLPARTRLFWRVVARSVQDVTRSTSPQGPILVPSWVALEVLNAPGGAQVPDPRPEFRWKAMPLPGSAGPFGFEVQVLLDREGEVIQSQSGLVDETHRFEEPLPFNVPLRWRVIATARNGVADTVSSAGPFVVAGGANPPVTILYQNFPNPFPSPEEGTWNTRIWFDLARESKVELAVYDMRGRMVRNLVPGPGCGPVQLAPGMYGRDAPELDPCTRFTWDGRDNRGGQVAPGVYLLRLRAGGVVDVRRVVYWP